MRPLESCQESAVFSLSSMCRGTHSPLTWCSAIPFTCRATDLEVQTQRAEQNPDEVRYLQPVTMEKLLKGTEVRLSCGDAREDGGEGVSAVEMCERMEGWKPGTWEFFQAQTSSPQASPHTHTQALERLGLAALSSEA